MLKLLTTKGKWYDLISNDVKKVDVRKGYRNIVVGDIICFVEADISKNKTGRACIRRVTLVIHSSDFPSHFGWKGEEFTIIQFEKELAL